MKKNKSILIVLLVVLFMSIGYAVLASAFDLNSVIGLRRQIFNIHFENPVLDGNDFTVISEPTYTDEKQTEINFEISLDKLGSMVSLNANIVNDGTIAGEIEEIKLNGIPENLSEYIFTRTIYEWGTELSVGDVLDPGDMVPVKIIIGYMMPEGNVEELPDTSNPITVTTSIKYVNTRKTGTSEIASLTTVTDPINDLIRINQNNIYSSKKIDFTKSFKNGTSGLFELKKENEVPIYFYRGNSTSTNNYLITNNYCWRIIRTTETGGIKLIFNGYQYNGMCDTYKEAYEYSYYSEEDNVDYSESLINQMFMDCSSGGGGGTVMFRGIRSASSSSDGGICDLSSNELIEDYTYCNNYRFYKDDITDLTCDDGRGMNVANGKLYSPIALIDVPEANLCGYNVYETSNSWLSVEYPWQNYWTMTGSVNYKSKALGIIGYDETSSLPNIDWLKVYPVITLKSTVKLSGEGTPSNPYIVEGLEPDYSSSGGAPK